nr:MAG TPA: hypothetical protein [Caudoviricetes sp.]
MSAEKRKGGRNETEKRKFARDSRLDANHRRDR